MIKKKLARVQCSWQRRAVAILVHCLLPISRFAPRRARVHWVGGYRRHMRPERFLFLLLFVTAFIILEPQEFVFWSTMWGGATSLFVVMATIYTLIAPPSPRGRGQG